MFSEKVIPSDWSDIIVEPIHKKWNKLDPAKYRAVSLLSICGRFLFMYYDKGIGSIAKDSQLKNSLNSARTEEQWMQSSL